jgi:hypothetical protein
VRIPSELQYIPYSPTTANTEKTPTSMAMLMWSQCAIMRWRMLRPTRVTEPIEEGIAADAEGGEDRKATSLPSPNR